MVVGEIEKFQKYFPDNGRTDNGRTDIPKTNGHPGSTLQAGPTSWFHVTGWTDNEKIIINIG